MRPGQPEPVGAYWEIQKRPAPIIMGKEYGKFIEDYRGFQIYEQGELGFAYYRRGYSYGRANSAWSCRVAIDEELQP